MFVVTSHQRLRERVQIAAQTPHIADSDANVHLVKRTIIATSHKESSHKIATLGAAGTETAVLLRSSSLDKCRTDPHNEVSLLCQC